MDSSTRMVCFVSVFFLWTAVCFADELSALGEKAREAGKIEQIRAEAARAKREAAKEAEREALEKAKAKLKEQIAEINLPDDTTATFTVRRLQISGNTLISTDELLKDMPLCTRLKAFTFMTFVFCMT